MAARPTRAWAIGLGGAALVVVVLVAARMFGGGSERDREPAATPPAARATTGTLEYVGSRACSACHAAVYARWQDSQHALAMQVADEKSVLGDFTDRRFRHQGVTSEFFRRDGKYMVRTDGPDGELADFEIRYTFGIYPLQQYLIELPGGHVQALSVAWDARPEAEGGQRWFHLYPRESIVHDDELHWTGRQQNWNHMCADCHSTNVQKNYEPATGTYATTWSEISVGCEACHGPGSAHVALAEAAAAAGEPLAAGGLTAQLDERRGVTWAIDPATGTAARSKPRASEREIEVCGQCHSRRSQFSDGYRAGEPLLDHYQPALLDEGLYHPDGQQRDEVYAWGSFLSSRMYAQGVTCGDCHEPHGGRLRASADDVCAQCHAASKYASTNHHFHEPGAPGSACVSCHMATETYMVVDPRHDHGFRIPRPDLSVTLGVPNACTKCHTDRSARWAADAVRTHYPERRPGFQGFAEAFAAADANDPAATIALTQVIANHDESAIARASALRRLARTPGETATSAAEAALEDPSPLVRAAAIDAFDALPPSQRRALVPLLHDPVRTVRMRAARSLASLTDDDFDAAGLEAFRKSADEYVAAERHNADRPEHRTNLGGFLAERGDYASAEAEYRAALQLDARFAPAWANLADMFRARGREADAEATLRDGLARSPADPTLHHALGLSLVRQQRKEEALRELRRATELDPDNARFRYVYEVAEEELGAAGAGR